MENSEDRDNLIIDVDDEGNEYVIDLDVCNAVVDSVFESLAEQESEIENFDFTAACYSMFIISYRILLDSGWSMEELTRDLQDQFDDHKKSMN